MLESDNNKHVSMIYQLKKGCFSFLIKDQDKYMIQEIQLSSKSLWINRKIHKKPFKKNGRNLLACQGKWMITY